MKIKFQYISFLALMIAVLSSCKKDNYDAPTSLLSGRLHYKGDTLNVEYDRVPFELYQYGFGRVGAIGETFDQQGMYSMLLFDGDYKFIIPNGQGPFMWNKTASGAPDSLTISMRGNQKLDIEVTPYYMPRNPSVVAKGRNIAGTFKTEQIVSGANAKNIEYVDIYINKTQFVSGADQVAFREYANDAIIDNNNILFNKFIPFSPITQGYYFVRFAIKITGVEDRIFSRVIKLDIGPADNYKRLEAESGATIGTAKKMQPDTTGVPTYDRRAAEASGRRFIAGLNTVGSGIDLTFSAPAAGTYMINLGGGTDDKVTDLSVYIDGNVAATKRAWFPKQGKYSYDIAPVEFDLSAGNHTISIRKAATNTGEVQIDWVDFFKYK